MMLGKKEKTSLLQTARTKNFGNSKFALLTLKSKDQPPVKKIKIPMAANGQPIDDGTKVSDMTASLTEQRVTPAVIKEVHYNGKPSDKDIEINSVESSVLGMSLVAGEEVNNSNNNNNKTQQPQLLSPNAHAQPQPQPQPQANAPLSPKPSTTLVQHRWMASAEVPEQDKILQQLKTRKFPQSPRSPPRSPSKVAPPQAGPRKKTMDISKGLKFSAPAPMTLSRCQPQMGQEKTAPQSKEYTRLQKEREKQEFLEQQAQNAADAKRVIEARLKEELEWEDAGEGFEAQLDTDGFKNANGIINNNTDENKNIVGNTIKKKSLVKKILGKVRPKSSAATATATNSKKTQVAHEKFTAIEAAMAAAAAAVDAAAEKQTNGGHLTEEEARSLAQEALVAARQYKTNNVATTITAAPLNKDHEEYEAHEEQRQQQQQQQQQQQPEPLNTGAVFHPYETTQASPPALEALASPRTDAAQNNNTSSDNRIIIHFGSSNNNLPSDFPISEVAVNPGGDSVSELDASHRNARKFPVVEVRQQPQSDESVSTLGVPRVFGQLDRLLESPRHMQTQRQMQIQMQQQRIGETVTHSREEDDMGGSAPPPEMVTSRDAKALIDQLESATMMEEATASTPENAAYGCNFGGIWFNGGGKRRKPTRKKRKDSLDRIETEYTSGTGDDNTGSFEETTLGDEEPMNDEGPTTLHDAIDSAIRNAEHQLSMNQTGRFTSYEGSNVPNSPHTGTRQSMSPLASPVKSPIARSPVTSRDSPASPPTPVEFDDFMNIAASKLDKISDTNSPSRSPVQMVTPQSSDPYASPKKRGSGQDKSTPEATPKRRGGENRPFFTPAESNFTESQFDLLSGGQQSPDTPTATNVPQEAAPVNAAAGASVNGHIVTDLTHMDDHHQQNRNQRPATERRRNPTEQGRFLLDTDDAYWDTLSTIASTANRSSESDEYMDEVTKPGPIPGEITTSGSDIQYNPENGASFEKEKFNSVVSIRGQTVTSPPKWDPTKAVSRSKPVTLNDMMNDVTDLIDAELLDSLPTSKINKGSIAGSTFSRPSTFSSPRPNPETMYGGNLPNSASNISKKISWGFEEIFEDKNDHSTQSDHFTNRTGGTSSSMSYSRSDQPSPEGMHRSSNGSYLSNESQSLSLEEEDMLSRTLELSKGLLETIMSSSVMQEKEARDRRLAGYDRVERPSSPSESRDESNNHQGRRTNNEITAPPEIQSRLDRLRMQREKALAKFELSKNALAGAKPGGMPPMNKSTQPVKRDRDRLKNYSVSHRYARAPPQTSGDRARRNSIFDSYSEEESELELKYTTSESNASDTPSQKARDLRVQIEEAMRASREIQQTQDQLGSELNTFKQRYYRNSLATRV